MIDFKNKEDCCGCAACSNKCPKHAISMLPDEEGFLYPNVNSSLCVNCGICERVCPIITPKKGSSLRIGYVLRNMNPEIVRDSTSGGAFTLFAEKIIKDGGVVFGAGYDESMNVICKEADSCIALSEMRGSKFVQSNVMDVYKRIFQLLNAGKVVLFSGTPCQVAGLVSFLENKPKNLVCIDFVCRGVPSPGLWSNYISMMEKKYGSHIIDAKFKNKTYGYHTSTMKIVFANGKQWSGSGRIDPMMKAFVNELASRPSCHNCKFKGLDRLSDITMFDCYEYSAVTGEKDDDKGYSSILVHTDRGADLIDSVKDASKLVHVSVNRLIETNGIMVGNSSKPNSKREEFYRLARELPIDKAIDAVLPISRKDYIIEALKSILYKTNLMGFVKRYMKAKNVEVQ